MKTEVLLSLLLCGFGTALTLFAFMKPGSQLPASMLGGALMGLGLALACPRLKSALLQFVLVMLGVFVWDVALLGLVALAR